jgi:hypothetical protein
MCVLTFYRGNTLKKTEKDVSTCSRDFKIISATRVPAVVTKFTAG